MTTPLWEWPWLQRLAETVRYAFYLAVTSPIAVVGAYVRMFRTFSIQAAFDYLFRWVLNPREVLR